MYINSLTWPFEVFDKNFHLPDTHKSYLSVENQTFPAYYNEHTNTDDILYFQIENSCKETGSPTCILSLTWRFKKKTDLVVALLNRNPGLEWT